MWKPFSQPRLVEVVENGRQDQLGTVFQWVRDRRAWLHLTGFLLFSTLIHGSGFYLFQVVYPPPLRVEPEADSIALLDSSNPDVRALLQRVYDRSVYLFPPSVDSVVRMQMEDARVRFTPSFQKEDLQPISPGFDWSLPPVLESVPSVIEPGAIEAPVLVSASGGLQSREIAPWSIMSDYLSRAEWLPEMEVSLLVDQDGKVAVLSVEGALEDEDRNELKSVIESTLRFLPSTEESKGTISIRSRSRENTIEIPAAEEE